ncbi:hypothetical protein IMCC14465_15570 [alpha proteobacterium IMCC14465]|uniref:Peptidase A2 domain-containing protein n=1 Tax=alpha proteobacterium IMCC14465 TaxID=1220535 RepID=J9A2X1_9PROT|nr:hypothetical protein IMCC14465_15570 [alpha proteobacterium IMCC14465]
MTEFEQARLTYLIIILVFIVCSFGFYYRKNFEKISRHFLSWCLIFIGLVTAYGFKDVLIAALFPYIGHQTGETFVYSKAEDGHFYLQLVINGEKVKFLLDTGATNLVLNKKTAESVGFDLNALSYNLNTYTANGISRSAKILIQEIKIGTLYERDVSAMVAEGDLFMPLLGMTFLSQFGEISINGDKLTL